MEEDEGLQEEQMTHVLYAATWVVNKIVQKGAEMLYDKYLQSILPSHELDTVVGSMRHILRGTFVARDFGEIWNDEMDTEAEPPTVWAWANGGIPVETKVVCKVPDEDEKDESIK